jgi:molybdenum cofactor guanylyltransferase
MGTNKALLKIEGGPLIGRVAECARSITDEVIVCANESAPYEFLGLPIVPDRFSGCGPLAGLHAAILVTRRPYVLLLACDLPNITAPLLTRIVSGSGGFDAVIPVTSDHCSHPLCALYSRNCLDRIEHNLQSGRLRMLDLFLDSPLHPRWLTSSEMGFHDYLFANLNTPDDLR